MKKKKEVLAKIGKETQGARTDLLPNIGKKSHDTRKIISDELGWSPGKVAMADIVSKKASEETKEKLRTGEISIHQAYEEIKIKEKAKDYKINKRKMLSKEELEFVKIAENPDIVEQIKKEAKENDELPTRKAVLKRIEEKEQLDYDEVAKEFEDFNLQDIDVMGLLKDLGVEGASLWGSRPKQRKFNRKSRIVIREIKKVLDEIEGALSTRQMYYQLISTGVIPPTKAGYNKVQRLLVDLRRQRIISFDRICDRTRNKHKQPSWNGMQDILEQCSIQYRRDYWVDQNTAIYIAVEKQALEGVFSEVCDDYGVSLFVLRGYPSLSLMYDWAEEITELNKEDKQVNIYYFGDFDATGIHIDESVASHLFEFGAEFTFKRIGVLPEDIEKFNLMTLPVKRTDTRAKKFIQEYGVECVELDALPPNELKQRIRSCIVNSIDSDKWERMQTIEQEEQVTLDKFISTLN